MVGTAIAIAGGRAVVAGNCKMVGELIVAVVAAVVEGVTGAMERKGFDFTWLEWLLEK